MPAVGKAKQSTEDLQRFLHDLKDQLKDTNRSRIGPQNA
jgi:hypothetical protein